MKILFLAPQPFYVERGTPIAVRLAVMTLCRAGHKVDLVTFHEGKDIVEPGLTHFRISRPPFVRRVLVGFSPAKLICDLWLAATAYKLLRKNRYDIVHAVEESIFLMFWRKRRGGFKLIYDMDSILSDQLVEKWRWLLPALPLFKAIENMAIRRADLVLPVCQAISDRIASVAAAKTHLLPDAAFTAEPGTADAGEDLRATLGIKGQMALYVGNLERYQGIDLLLASFAEIEPSCSLVIIGGNQRDIEIYRALAVELGLSERVHLIGPRALANLPDYLRQADVLCSPRLRGVNTPMKLYSYMASGRPIIATDIASHTQVLSHDSAVLASPTPSHFGKGLARLLSDVDLRRTLADRAQKLVRETYSIDAFEKRLANAYATL